MTTRKLTPGPRAYKYLLTKAKRVEQDVEDYASVSPGRNGPYFMGARSSDDARRIRAQRQDGTATLLEYSLRHHGHHRGGGGGGR